MSNAIDSIYGTQQPYAVSTNDPEAHWGDTVVTQGHADYCAAYGHVTFVANITGKPSERCGRCGELVQQTLDDDYEPGGISSRIKQRTELFS